MTAYTFRISLSCPHCRAGVPINGFAFEVLCQNCQKTIELPQEWWESILDSETVDKALDFEPGTGTTTSHLGGMNEKIDSGNRSPRCQDCKEEFSQELLQNSVAKEGFPCPGCAKHIRVRKATPLALSLIPEADLLVHEDETGEGLSIKDEKAEPIMFACMACGAGLPIDGLTRTPKCTHCGSTNYLPDSLWVRLHPAQVTHAFFVTRDVNAKRAPVTVESLNSDLFEEKALRILKDPNLEPAVLYRIYEIRNDEEDVMTALAKHPNTPDDLLLKISTPDAYYETRVAVAKRPLLPLNVIEALSEDIDSDLKKALLARKDLYKLPQNILERILSGTDVDELGKDLESPDFPEWKLYDLSDDCSLEDATKILKSPNVSLRVLKRIGANSENRPLMKKHPLYQGLGFFRRLFF